MKTVVITGSTRGLGFEMARQFCMNGANVVINGINEKRLEDAVAKLREIASGSEVDGFAGNVATSGDIRGLVAYASGRFGSIDIWINNAGVNQPMKAIWELTEEEINALIDVDLRGTVLGSRAAMLQMEQQPNGGYIYNVEGYGSNNATMLGLSIYGTSKRAITYFTEALAKECSEKGTGVIIGKLSPGIMITDFITNALANKEKITLSEKTKKVYNILGDYPDVVANFLVNGMINNTKNNAKIDWLPTRKAAWRFMTAGFNKRDFFKEK